MMFTSVGIKGFRGIDFLEIEGFKEINLFVGSNQCGKTTVLEALFLLCGGNNPRLPVNINQFRDYVDFEENYWKLFFRNAQESALVYGELTKLAEKRVIRLSQRPKSPLRISEENNNESEKNNKKIDLDSSSTTVPVDGLYHEYEFGKTDNYEKDLRIIKSEVNSEGFKSGKKLKPLFNGIWNSPATRKTTLFERFVKLFENKNTDYLVEVLNRIEPKLTDLSPGRNGYVLCDIGLSKRIPVNLMGDGMFSILSLLVDMFASEDGVLMIDEIENGLHYSSQNILWEGIFRANEIAQNQVFATTHSIESVKAFFETCRKIKGESDSIRLYRIERHENSHKAVSFDVESMESFFESGWEMR